MSDSLLAVAAIAFERTCVLVFALLLQQPLIKQHRSRRYTAGLMMATAVLMVQPVIYNTPTQMYGLICAAFGSLTAWCILHWTFVEQHEKQCTVLEVVLSPTAHALEGVVKVHQRFLHLHSGSSQPSARRQQQQQQVDGAQPGTSINLWLLLQQAVATLLTVQLTCDLGMAVLCSCSSGMCTESGMPAWLGAGSSAAAPADARGLQSYLAKCMFAFPAGILLTQQIEVIYSAIRLIMILAAFRWPAFGQAAAQLPLRVCNWPAAARSVSELWGYRWHQLLRFYFEGLGGVLVDALFPKHRTPRPLRATMRCVAAFAMSGLLHEYLTWAVFDVVTGWHMAFFMLNCVAVLLESWVPALVAAVLRRRSSSSPREAEAGTVTAQIITKANKVASSSSSDSDSSAGSLNGYAAYQAAVPGWLQRAWTLSFFILLGPLFVEPCRAAGFFGERAFHPFGAPLTPAVMGWVQGAGRSAGLV